MNPSPITERTSSRLARASAMNELSPCRTIAGGSSLSCSSSISPTICSRCPRSTPVRRCRHIRRTTSAMDPRPALRQEVDRTHRRRQKSSLRMMLASASGRPDRRRGRSSLPGTASSRLPSPCRRARSYGHERQQVADVHDAFGSSEGLVVDTSRECTALSNRLIQFAERDVALDRDDVGAMDHDIAMPVHAGEDIAQTWCARWRKTDLVRRRTHRARPAKSFADHPASSRTAVRMARVSQFSAVGGATRRRPATTAGRLRVLRGLSWWDRSPGMSVSRRSA